MSGVTRWWQWINLFPAEHPRMRQIRQTTPAEALRKDLAVAGDLRAALDRVAGDDQ